MTEYLVAIHHPDGYDGSAEGPGMTRDIAALNVEMKAAGIRRFVGGLEGPEKSKAIRRRPDGTTFVTDGPYIETKEHIGGFWVLELATLEEALEWGRKAAIACRAPVEVRAFAIPPVPGS